MGLPSRITTIALAAFAVTILLAQPMGIGFATGGSDNDDVIIETGTTYYSGSTVNTDNAISTDYFVAKLYRYTGTSASDVVQFDQSLFTEVSGEPFACDGVNYTKSGTTYSVTDGSTSMTDDSVFLVIDSARHSGTGTYSVSYSVNGLTDRFTSGTSQLTWGGNNGNIVNGYAYRLSLSLSDLYYSGSEEPYLSLSISITVTDGSNGSYLSPTNTVAFKLVSASEELKKTLEELNPDFLNDGMAFVVDDDGNPPGIYIQNSGSDTHSIAAKDDGNSTIDTVVKVPSDVYFCVYVSIADASTLLSHSSVTVQISKKNLSTGTTTSLGSITLSEEGMSKYICMNGNRIASQDTQPNKQSNYIHCGDGEELVITFSGQQRSTWFGYGSQTMTVSAKLVQYGQ